MCCTVPYLSHSFSRYANWDPQTGKPMFCASFKNGPNYPLVQKSWSGSKKIQKMQKKKNMTARLQIELSFEQNGKQNSVENNYNILINNNNVTNNSSNNSNKKLKSLFQKKTTNIAYNRDVAQTGVHLVRPILELGHSLFSYILSYRRQKKRLPWLLMADKQPRNGAPSSVRSN